MLLKIYEKIILKTKMPRGYPGTFHYHYLLGKQWFEVTQY